MKLKAYHVYLIMMLIVGLLVIIININSPEQIFIADFGHAMGIYGAGGGVLLGFYYLVAYYFKKSPNTGTKKD